MVSRRAAKANIKFGASVQAHCANLQVAYSYKKGFNRQRSRVIVISVLLYDCETHVIRFYVVITNYNANKYA